MTERERERESPEFGWGIERHLNVPKQRPLLMSQALLREGKALGSEELKGAGM
jgi:hypothetical protein